MLTNLASSTFVITAASFFLMCLHITGGQDAQGMGPMTLEETLRAIMHAAEDLETSVGPRLGDQEDEEEMQGVVDCFGLPRFLYRTVRSWFTAEKTVKVNTRFLLVTRNSSTEQEIRSGREFSLADTGFDPRRQTVMIVHGFFADTTAKWMKEMSQALLSQGDMNVFLVDWSGGGGSIKYWKAVANTRVAGKSLARFVQRLISKGGASPGDFHLIGHSLGAHICSYAAVTVGGIARITGLDPAQPCYNYKDRNMVLDPSDANFVDVIHTNGRLISKIGLGFPQPVGHVDFYPNGGMKQPGCSSGRRSLFNLLPVTLTKIAKAVCNHGRSYQFFIESIMSHDCYFWGHQWDMKPESGELAVMSPCSITNCSLMGYEAVLFPARGVFYVTTADTMPFCINFPETDLEMAHAMLDFENMIDTK